MRAEEVSEPLRVGSPRLDPGVVVRPIGHGVEHDRGGELRRRLEVAAMPVMKHAAGITEKAANALMRCSNKQALSPGLRTIGTEFGSRLLTTRSARCQRWIVSALCAAPT